MNMHSPPGGRDSRIADEDKMPWDSEPPPLPPAKRMMALFAGAAHHYSMRPGPVPEPGQKRDKDYRVAPSAATEAEWRAHLSGKVGLVVVPVREDGTCVFGAIDIDDYTLGAPEILATARRTGLPLVPCQSTSGGAHLYLFLSEPVPAAELRAALKAAAARAGYADAEIFPKQDVLSEKGTGSGINMPYFSSERPALGYPEGIPMAVQDFLRDSEAAKVSAAELRDLVGKQAGASADNRGTSTGAPTGHMRPAGRGDAEARLRLHGRKIVGAIKRDANNRLTAAAFDLARYCRDTGLPEEEARSHMLRAWTQRKDQEGGAEGEFDKLWRRQFDKGTHKGLPAMVADADAMQPIDRAQRVVDGEDVVYRVYLLGEMIEVSAQDLYDQKRFNVQALRQAGLVLRLSRNKNDWIDHITEAVQNAEVVEAEMALSLEGQFRELLDQFLTNRQRGEAREHIILGRPWEDDETRRHYFRLTDLERFVRMHKTPLATDTRQSFGKRLRALGGKPTDITIKGKTVGVFWVPSGLFQPTPEADLPPLKADPL